VKLLRGRRYDSEPTRQFLVNRLLTEKSPDRWKQRIAEFQATAQPEEVAMLPDLLNRLVEESSYSRSTPQDRQHQELGRQILATAYPDYDPERPAFINAAAEDDKAELLLALVSVSSDRLVAALGLVEVQK
jgi:hypothetical protein